MVFRLSLFVTFGNGLFTVLLPLCLKPLVLRLRATLDRKFGIVLFASILVNGPRGEATMDTAIKNREPAVSFKV